MKLKIIILLLGVLYTYHIRSQTITLYTTDSLTGAPVGGAMARSVAGKFFQSDRNGIIRLPCESGWICITAAGFHPDSVLITCQDTQRYIKLCSDEIHLDAFELKGRRDQESGIQTIRIGKQDMEIQRLNTTADMLQHVPGIALIKTGNGVAKPVIRGLTGYRVLQIYDGYRQEGQQWGLDHGMEIDPSGIGSIKVIKGGGSIVYGSEGSGGVILMSPMAYRPALGAEGNTYLSFSSNNKGLSIAQQYLYTHKSWSLKAAGNFKYTGDGHTPEYNLSNTGMRNANAQIHIRFGSPSHFQEISYVHFYQKNAILRASHADNISALQQMIASGKPVIIKPFTYAIGHPQQEVFHEQLNYHNKNVLRGGWIQLFSQSIQFNHRNEFDATNPALSKGVTPNFSTSLGYSFSEYKMEKHFQHDWNFIVGGQHHFMINQSNGRRYFIPDFISNKSGVYGLLETARGRWKISAGSRFDYIYNHISNIRYQPDATDHRNYQGLSGIVSATLKLNKGYVIELHSGSGWRAPHVSELYTLGFHGATGNFEKGNIRIEKELFHHQEISVHKMGEHLQWNANVFYNFFKNYIYLKPTGNAITTINGSFPEMLYSQDPAAIWGGEFLISYHFGRHHQVNSGLNYMRSRNLSTGYAIWLLPPSRGFMNYTFQKLATNWNIQLEYQYITSQKYIQPGTDFAVPPPAYGLLSCLFNGSVKIHQRNWKISLVMNNMLNKNYRDYLSRYRYFASETGRDLKLLIHIPYNNTQKHIH